MERKGVAKDVSGGSAARRPVLAEVLEDMDYFERFHGDDPVKSWWYGLKRLLLGKMNSERGGGDEAD